MLARRSGRFALQAASRRFLAGSGHGRGGNFCRALRAGATAAGPGRSARDRHRRRQRPCRAGLCADQGRRHHQGQDRQGSDRRQLESDGCDHRGAAEFGHRADRHQDRAILDPAGLCAAAAAGGAETCRLQRLQPNHRDGARARQGVRHSRSHGRCRRDRHRQRLVPAFRSRQGARPGPRSRRRRCAAQGRALRARRGLHARPRSLAHRGHRHDATRSHADVPRPGEHGGAGADRAGEDTLRVQITVGFDIAN